MRELRLNSNSPHLRQALNETQKKADFEKQRADDLAEAVASRESQLRSLSAALQAQEAQAGPGELRRLKGDLAAAQGRLAQLEAENRALAAGRDRALREKEAEAKAGRETQFREMERAAQQNQRAIQTVLEEKDKSARRLLEMKEQQLRQLGENLDFFKREAQAFKKTAEAAKRARSHKEEALEKQLAEQSDQMQLMRRDLMLQEKELRRREEALAKAAEAKGEFKAEFFKKRQGRGINEYSFGQNQSQPSGANQAEPEARAKHTLLSEGGAEVVGGNKQGALVQSTRLRDPGLEEPERAKRAAVRELEDSNNLLRSKLATLADDKDSLEAELRKLRRRLEDLGAEAEDRNKWRRKALDAEGRAGEAQELLERERKRRKREAEAEAEESARLAREVERVTREASEREKVISELRVRGAGPRADLRDLLANLKAGAGDSGQSKELLREIAKKVDELFAKSGFEQASARARRADGLRART